MLSPMMTYSWLIRSTTSMAQMVQRMKLKFGEIYWTTTWKTTIPPKGNLELLMNYVAEKKIINPLKTKKKQIRDRWANA